MAASKVLASAVYEATPRDPLVLCGVVVAMALLRAIAGWADGPNSGATSGSVEEMYSYE
jgi:hypothetical protein